MEIANFAEKICCWSKPAFISEEIFDELVQDLMCAFEYRSSFTSQRKSIENMILSNGLPDDVKAVYDRSTEMMNTVGLSLEMRKKRSSIQTRVKRLVAKMEIAIYGVVPLAPKPTRKSTRVARKPKRTNLAAVAVADPINSAAVAVADTINNAVADICDTSIEEDDDDDDTTDFTATADIITRETYDELAGEDKDLGVISLKLKPDIKIFVVGDQVKYNELYNVGFKSVFYKEKLDHITVDENFDLLFYGR